MKGSNNSARRRLAKSPNRTREYILAKRQSHYIKDWVYALGGRPKFVGLVAVKQPRSYK